MKANGFHYVTEEPRFYPRCDEVETVEEPCPNCGHELFTRTCSDCGGEGYWDAYELDPLWYDEGDTVPCGLCGGDGNFLWCPRCNWDANRPANRNLPEHRQRAIVKVKV